MKYLLTILLFLLTGCGLRVHLGNETLGNCVDVLVARYKLEDVVKEDFMTAAGIVMICANHNNNSAIIIKELGLN